MSVLSAAKAVLAARYDQDGWFTWRVPGERLEALGRAIAEAEARHRAVSRQSMRRRRARMTLAERDARRAYSREWMRRRCALGGAVCRGVGGGRMSDLDRLQRESGEWSAATFPHQTVHSKLTHLRGDFTLAEQTHLEMAKALARLDYGAAHGLSNGY